MKKLLAVVAVCALFPLAAGAESIKPALGTYYMTGTVSIPGDTPAPITGNFYIGQMAVKWDGVTYQAYCVDLFTDYSLGDSWTPVERRMADLPIVTGGVSNPPFALAGTGPSAAWLVNQHAASIGSARDAAALQLALWLTLYQGLPATGFSFGSQTDYVRATALEWAEAARGRSGDDIWLDFQGPAGMSHGQDLVLPDSVPEPASMLLFGTGLIGLATMARKRMRR